jgi:Uma2 family endonuclease
MSLLRQREAIPRGRITEEEFLAWRPELVRAEWVDGKVVVISPSNVRHSHLVGFLLTIIRAFARKQNLGDVHCENFLVRFRGQRRLRLPDLMFVSKKRLRFMRSSYFDGAPDLVMEVVSPNSVKADWDEKYAEYEAAGVREYWVIDPIRKRVAAYSLGQDARFQPISKRGGRVESVVLTRFWLKPAWLWQEPLPIELDVLREMGV